jgi:large subunit ribosomal protein L24
LAYNILSCPAISRRHLELKTVKIHKGDEVVVLSGKDKGKRGAVREAIPSKERVIVEGVNMVKKHQRPRPGVRQSGIVERENPLHVSNVMLYCPQCNTPTRVGVRREDGKKTRLCKRCGQSVDRR